jgi:hypothetical protein
MAFTWTGDENCPLPLCTVCGGKTIKYGYGDGKFKSNFTTNHSHIQNKKISSSDLCSQNKQRKFSEKKGTFSEKAQEASYLGVVLTAKKKIKSHIIAESLIMPACEITEQ